MLWWHLLILVLAVALGVSLVLFALVRWLGRREPYRAFLGLPHRKKVAFFRVLLRDRHGLVPRYVKLIPWVLLVYLAVPFDLIPDFVPVLGYLDDVALVLLALVLIIKLTPDSVVSEALRQARQNHPPSEVAPGSAADSAPR